MAEPELKPQVPGEEQEQDPVPEAEAAPAPKHKGRAKAEAPVVGLPESDSVDPNKITRAVLTKQGWVVPIAKPKAA